MRTLGLLLSFLFLPIAGAAAQETEAADGARITSSQIAGMRDHDDLSPGLRADVSALVGEPLSRARLNELVARIEAERPDFVGAARAVTAGDGEARVVFFIARVHRGDDDEDYENINARYVVEAVEIVGVVDSLVSQKLRDDLRALVGSRIDSAALLRLSALLRSELTGYEVDRTVSRGSQRGQVRVVFDVRRGEGMRWLHFAPSKSKLLYHSDQGWSGLLDLRIGNRDVRVSPIFALDNGDDLLEEYRGVGVRVEHRNIGSERLGVALELTSFDQDWNDATLAALALNPGLPEAYGSRKTVSPSLTFAFTPHVHAAAGVSISELESLATPSISRTANVVVASVGYDQSWERREVRHGVRAAIGVRTASDALESDLDYTRYLATADYALSWGRSDLLVSGMVGRVTGAAPLFERFSLGDSTTLRGWNKFDIAPAGGDRMTHTTLEFRNRGLAFFLDAGSVWDEGSTSEIRTAAGFGYHRESVFFTVGFPLNTKDVNATFMMGVRF